MKTFMTLAAAASALALGVSGPVSAQTSSLSLPQLQHCAAVYLLSYAVAKSNNTDNSNAGLVTFTEGRAKQTLGMIKQQGGDAAADAAVNQAKTLLDDITNSRTTADAVMADMQVCENALPPVS